MTLVASTIPNLVSGVSQQPAPSRLRTSGEEIINGFPTVVTGLLKRPPSEFVAELFGSITGTDAAVHTIDRDGTEKYILVSNGQSISLFDDQGNPQTVTTPDGVSYLPTADNWRKLRFVTVADTTFILNTEKTVGTISAAETRSDPTATGSVFVKRAVASVNYAIYVNGVLAGQMTTSDNTTAGTALEGTAEIASQLAASLVTNGYADAQAVGTTVTFSITSGDVVTVLDQFGGAAMQAYTSSLQEFSDLPPSELQGRLVEIKGDLDELGESYWVEYDNGVWTETLGYNAQETLDPATMPHILVKTGPGTFEFRRAEWGARIAGDADSNPSPSFAGSTVNNMFLFKGRLGLLSGENVILSEVANLENFYRTTVVQLLASDVIDVASTTGRVSTLYHAASFSDELILFSDKQQFRLSSGTTLSAETVGITNSTGYPCSTVVSPVTSGSSAYFVADGATHSVAREIFIDADRETVNGEDIAVQVPSYIPKNLRGLAASNASDVFLAVSEAVPNEMYVYKWYTTNRRKVQSAWCKWVFDPSITIMGAGFLDDYLYFVYKSGTRAYLDRILVGPVIDKELLLDHQVDQTEFVSMTYNAGLDVTEIRLPYQHSATIEFYRTDDQSGAPYEGVVRVDADDYTIPGDVTGHGITAGLNYEFLYEFSTQYLREENSDGESAIQDGRLQLRYMSVIYSDSSYFEAHVTPTNGTTKVTVFNGRTLADPDNLANLIPRDTGEFKFPVFAQNEEVTIQLKSNQPYRCAFGSVEWTAIYKPKARRV